MQAEPPARVSSASGGGQPIQHVQFMIHCYKICAGASSYFELSTCQQRACTLYHRYNRLLGKCREDRRGRLSRKMANFFVNCLAMQIGQELGKRLVCESSTRAPLGVRVRPIGHRDEEILKISCSDYCASVSQSVSRSHTFCVVSTCGSNSVHPWHGEQSYNLQLLYCCSCLSAKHTCIHSACASVGCR